VFVFSLFLALLIPAAQAAAQATVDECRSSPEYSLQELKNSAADPDARASAGQCLSRYFLDKPEVAQAFLKIIRNPREDLLLREDLIQAFADANLRRKVRVEQALTPKLKPEDSAAVNRTVASAGDILAVAQAVKSMEETVPTTRFEADFFRAFSEIVADDSNHVVLREVAVGALEKISEKAVKSGVYDDRNIRLAQETLRTVGSRADSGSFFTGANGAYERLAGAGLPHFAEPGRMLSSISGK
jgi:hypothetical protein